MDAGLITIIPHLLIVLMLTISTMFNPKLAWANGNNLKNAPDWVKTRVKPLTKETIHKWEFVETLGTKLFG